ncbi:MAG: hypothetical protein JXR42_01670 [Gammaproteobacteria bacterium]|nr:hypothetical protein [Gammaproteobacteria bacterium]
MKTSNKVLSGILVVFIVITVSSAVILRRQVLSEYKWHSPQEILTIHKEFSHQFNKVVVAVGQPQVHLSITKSEKPSVTVSSFMMFKPYLKVSNKNGVLSVYTPDHIKLTSSLPIDIAIATDKAISDVKVMN